MILIKGHAYVLPNYKYNTPVIFKGLRQNYQSLRYADEKGKDYTPKTLYDFDYVIQPHSSITGFVVIPDIMRTLNVVKLKAATILYGEV